MQCKCVIHMASGEVRRCGQLVFNPDESHYCHWHTKVFDELADPAPQDMYEPGVEKDYIVSYANCETGEFRKVAH